MRFKDTKLTVGYLPSGATQSITDVPGVLVGHKTKVEGDRVRTGVTVIDPGVKDLFRSKVPAAFYVENGFGKVAGITQVEELGVLDVPIALTNTTAVGIVMDAMNDIVARGVPDLLPYEAVNAVVGESNAWIVNDIRVKSLTKEDVEAAFASRANIVEVGNVGAGTGTRAFSWKGGIGSASRVLSVGGTAYTVGVLAQTNFGGSLTMLGVPIGKLLGKNDFEEFVPKADGSCMVVLATDAPLTARQLKRIAKRAILGLVRTGSIIAHSSGDYCIAFSTNRAGIEGAGAGDCLPESALNGFFLAAMEATEEAVYDALFAAETMTGRDGNIMEALPKEQVLELIRKYAAAL